ncbi:hypothetical protein, partial [Aquitalea sp. LB_tupeE]|uniref:hypothetical protein n=1 Tax=Aquitalea sp. LB_tupeE TaxID=2748078 RepID=UPI001C4CB3C4
RLRRLALTGPVTLDHRFNQKKTACLREIFAKWTQPDSINYHRTNAPMAPSSMPTGDRDEVLSACFV